MWSEPDSVAYTESDGHLVDHLGSVHIVEERLKASAESRRVWTSGESSRTSLGERELESSKSKI